MYISEEDEARMDHSADILKDFLQEQQDLLWEAVLAIRSEDSRGANETIHQAIGKCQTMLMIIEHT